jgi:hypothetical protein
MNHFNLAAADRERKKHGCGTSAAISLIGLMTALFAIVMSLGVGFTGLSGKYRIFHGPATTGTQATLSPARRIRQASKGGGPHT